jgi:phosphoglycerol transferase MdoB-like AlkP superfamily enzyme
LVSPGLPKRFALPLRLLISFVVFNAAVRLGLLIFNGDFSLLAPAKAVPIFAIGMVFDVAAGVWWLPLFVMLTAFWPSGWQRSLRLAAGLMLLLMCAMFSFIAVAEFLFWNEFAARFNFIAVDYLIYTREVLGNIRESYDLRPAYAAIVTLTLLLFAGQRGALRAAVDAAAPRRRQGLAALAVALLLPVMSFFLVQPRFKEFSEDAQAVQLAGNGHYEFWSAFRNNEIDYAQFYKSAPLARAYAVLRSEFTEIGPTNFRPNARMPIDRDVAGRGDERHLNVVLISVESLSAEFMSAFGNRENLTPNLDRLAGESLFFTRLYATGLRTVRGLEAITLSVPPTPGNSIIKRPNNENLATLGEVFKERGYEPLFLYGGYGYFDNMNAFFGGNGYTVVDRTAIAKDRIHHENIWGVADEDLYSMALEQLDRRHAANKLFFAHIMTTSNHRPFTYPPGRIDIPSGTSRAGAVKYTDWALHEFIRQARERPWFKDTVFVILADHTASGRGKTDLPVENFHIPLLVWSPGNIKPARIDTLASQIDVGPTLLALLNFSYRSRFFGHDIIHDGPGHQRAFMANYQTVGYMEGGVLVELRPQRRWRLIDVDTGKERAADERGMHYLEEAVSYYQAASEAYRSGSLGLSESRP